MDFCSSIASKNLADKAKSNFAKISEKQTVQWILQVWNNVQLWRCL